MNQQEHMMNFYKVIYSERSLNPMAAKIVAEETDKMIIATKQLFYAMEVHKLLHFINPDMSAVSFAMTIHGLMDYELDQSNGKCSYETDKNLLGNDQLSGSQKCHHNSGSGMSAMWRQR